MQYSIDKIWIGITRISIGWLLLWAFFDKLFGLGFSTAPEKSWLAGGSPTKGFLAFATKGPFQSLFQVIAGQPIVDWLFMLGLLCIGLALILGIGVKIAGYTGALLFFLMYLAVLPPEHNPILDEHIIYALIVLGFTFVPSGKWLGFGAWWAKRDIVKRFPILS